jgi:hypothetical protein
MSSEKADKVNKAIELMRFHGADIIDPVNVTGIGDRNISNDLTNLFRYTFRHDISNYLSELKNTTMRSVKDLIDFNIKHSDQEFHKEYSPDQNIFLSVENLTNMTADDYATLYNKSCETYGHHGIDAA